MRRDDVSPLRDREFNLVAGQLDGSARRGEAPSLGRRALLLLPLAVGVASLAADDASARRKNARTRLRLDQKNVDAGGAGFGFGLSNTASVTQTFTVGIAGRLAMVAVQLGQLTSTPGPPRQVIAEIFALGTTGTPDTATGALATGRASTAAVSPTPLGWLAIELSPPLAVVAGQRFGLVLQADAPADHGWFGSSGFSGDLYPRGGANGDAGSDFFFKTYVSVPAKRRRRQRRP